MIEKGTLVVIDVEKANDLGPLLKRDLRGMVRGEVIEFCGKGVGPYGNHETYHIDIKEKPHYGIDQHVNINAVTPMLPCEHEELMFHDRERKWVCPFCYED